MRIKQDIPPFPVFLRGKYQSITAGYPGRFVLPHLSTGTKRNVPVSQRKVGQRVCLPPHTEIRLKDTVVLITEIAFDKTSYGFYEFIMKKTFWAYFKCYKQKSDTYLSYNDFFDDIFLSKYSYKKNEAR